MFRIVLAVLLLVATSISARHQKMNLQKALDLKLVKTMVNSLGGHQGYCIKMEIRNLSPDSLMLVVEAGRRLNSIMDLNQDILITREEFITLKTNETKSFKVKGYCCQSSNCSPSKDAKYDINKMAEPALVQVAKYLNCHNYQPGVEQGAVWAISDKRPTANITTEKDSALLPLRQFVSGLKGEKIPWYTVISTCFVYPSGAMQNIPLFLRGDLEYNNDNESFASLVITNEKGIPVCMVKSGWLQAGQNEKYTLNVPVKGLSNGKYTIELRTREKSLGKKEFEI